MTLTLTADTLTVTVSVAESHVDAATDLCGAVLLAAGYDPVNVAEAFAEWGTQRASLWQSPLDTDGEPV
jgi:hypothetical protein